MIQGVSSALPAPGTHGPAQRGPNGGHGGQGRRATLVALAGALAAALEAGDDDGARVIHEMIGRMLAALPTEAATPVDVAHGSSRGDVRLEAGRGEAGELRAGSASPAMPAAPAAEVEHEAAPIVDFAAARARAGARAR